MKKIILSSLLVLWYVLLPIKGVIAEDHTPFVMPTETKALISYYAKKYKVSEKDMLIVAKCESGINQNVRDGDNGLARGIFQYHQPTWIQFSKQIGKEMDRNFVQDQVDLTAWVFSKGYQHHWTCFKDKVI